MFQQIAPKAHTYSPLSFRRGAGGEAVREDDWPQATQTGTLCTRQSECNRLFLLLALLFVCAVRPALADAGTPVRTEHSIARVQTVHLPDGGVVPDVAYDEHGVLHVVYGRGMDAYYTQSTDGGLTFRTPVRLNTREGTVTVGGERGPKLALSQGGAIQVLWQGHYQKGGGIWVTRSTDGGKTFVPERNILDTKIGIDEPTITADAQGNVCAFWLDGRLPPNAENQVATPLFMARSTDNGATFGPNEALKTDFPGRGCSCCMLWARIVGPEVYVAFRTGYRNIRDMMLLRGAKTANKFQATRVSADHWLFEGCPMSGPRFMIQPASGTSTPGNHILIAWMSQGNVYWTHSEEDGKAFAPRIAAPGGGSGNYPTIVSSPRGDILLLWTREGQAQWALYKPDNLSAPIAKGVAGATTGRPIAYVRPDGTFAILL